MPGNAESEPLHNAGDRIVEPRVRFKRVGFHWVFLVHGASSNAVWENQVQARYRRAGIVVERITYKAPYIWRVPYFADRRVYFRKIERQMNDHLPKIGADDFITIICHSYGTYLVVHWLQRMQGIRVKNLVMMASVVSRRDLAAVRNRVDRIINDVFEQDRVPAWAEALRPAHYEATGVFGFPDNILNQDPPRDDGTTGRRTGVNRQIAGGHNVEPDHVLATLEAVVERDGEAMEVPVLIPPAHDLVARYRLYIVVPLLATILVGGFWVWDRYGALLSLP